MSLGANKAALLAMGSAAGGGNYFGDGSDGALTTTGDVTYTVLNKSGSYDGDMVVKNYTSLTIGAGHTITTDQPCRGMLIYVKGDCSISGTLNARIGALADPTNTGGSDSAAVNANGLRLPLFTASGSQTLSAADFAGCGNAAVTAVANQAEISGDGTIFQILKAGASGGSVHNIAGNTSNTFYNSQGTDGGNGTTTASSGQCGGGATGGYNFHSGNSGGQISGSAGGLAGTFSGGAGGGSTALRISSSPGYNLSVGAVADYGGAGGGGSRNWQNCYSASGGAGNPAGSSGGDNAGAAQSIVGGILWLIVKGDLTIASGGSITALGGSSGTTNSACQQGASGGASGGGVLMLLHGGTYSNSGTVTANGGTAGSAPNATGGDGGNGSVVQAQIST